MEMFIRNPNHFIMTKLQKQMKEKPKILFLNRVY